MTRKLEDITLTLLRMVTGILFVPNGYAKLFGEQPVDLTSMMGTAGVLEFFGGTLIVLGLFTRPIAFLLSGQMAVAYWLSHAPRAPWPIDNDGELAVLFCFIYLVLSVHGGGDFSIDRLIRRREG